MVTVTSSPTFAIPNRTVTFIELVYGLSVISTVSNTARGSKLDIDALTAWSISKDVASSIFSNNASPIPPPNCGRKGFSVYPVVNIFLTACLTAAASVFLNMSAVVSV